MKLFFYPKVTHPDISQFTLHKAIVNNNISVNYATIGKGRPILLIHGLSNNWYSLVPLANCLKDKYKLYLIDLPGYGDSSSLPEYSIDIFADYLAQFIQMMKVKPYAIGGLSMSTCIITRFAEKYPQYACSLLYFSPYIKTNNYTFLTNMLTVFSHYARNNNLILKCSKYIINLRISAYISSYLFSIYRPNFNASLIDTYSLFGRRKMRKELYMTMVDEIRDTDLASSMPNIDCRKIIIMGEDDRICNPNYVKHILSMKKNNKLSLKMIPRAGHWVIVEKPEACALNIKELLEN